MFFPYSIVEVVIHQMQMAAQDDGKGMSLGQE